jgi:ABC-2 type transport system ATP-binding protein
MTAAISTERLTKYYGEVVGVEDLTLEVAEGEVFGFLGANGSGKTTTIRLLLDLLRPSAGRAAVAGFDCQRQSLETRRRIAYLPGEMPVYPELTGGAYLDFLAALGDRAVAPGRRAPLLRRFEVSEVDLRRRLGDYSHGMKRKLGLIQALVTESPVVILDEPTAGLDPLMIEAFFVAIDELAAAGGTTVFLSSHVLSEVDRLCTRVALIRAGRLVAVRSLEELRASVPRRMNVRFSEAVDGTVPAIAGARIVPHDPYHWSIEVSGPLGAVFAALGGLPVADLDVDPFRIVEAVLALLSERSSC